MSHVRTIVCALILSILACLIKEHYGAGAWVATLVAGLVVMFVQWYDGVLYASSRVLLDSENGQKHNYSEVGE